MNKMIGLFVAIVFSHSLWANDDPSKVLVTIRAIDAHASVGLEGIAVEFSTLKHRGPLFLLTRVPIGVLWTGSTGEGRIALWVDGDLMFNLSQDDSLRKCRVVSEEPAEGLLKKSDLKKRRVVEITYRLEQCKVADK